MPLTAQILAMKTAFGRLLEPLRFVGETGDFSGFAAERPKQEPANQSAGARIFTTVAALAQAKRCTAEKENPGCQFGRKAAGVNSLRINRIGRNQCGMADAWLSLRPSIAWRARSSSSAVHSIATGLLTSACSST